MDMMPPYRLAHLNPDQMMSIENMENELGLTLIAWEPEQGADTATNNMATAASDDDLVLDALNDTYRTYDPQFEQRRRGQGGPAFHPFGLLP